MTILSGQGTKADPYRLHRKDADELQEFMRQAELRMDAAKTREEAQEVRLRARLTLMNFGYYDGCCLKIVCD